MATNYTANATNGSQEQLASTNQLGLGPVTPRLVEQLTNSELHQLEIQKQVKTATQQARAVLREFCPFGRHFF